MPIPTKKQYDAASPREKGYMAYTYAYHPMSSIPEGCPFKHGTDEHREFHNGEMQAILEAQDSES
ncbi:MAG: hypothetical protein Q7N50_09980 [Armatimonadota bacterium]|nr:hypothetical protein [Armatimonadota bacterium]